MAQRRHAPAASAVGVSLDMSRIVYDTPGGRAKLAQDSARAQLFVGGIGRGAPPAARPRVGSARASEEGTLPSIIGKSAVQRTSPALNDHALSLLSARCAQLEEQAATLASRLAAAELEATTLRERNVRVEASERRIRSDLQHITHRNDILEKILDAVKAERAAAAAASAESPSSAAADEASDASTSAALDSPSSAKMPARPSTPQHTHSFLHLVERGLNRELERAAAAAERGPSPAPAGAATTNHHSVSLRAQLRQLSDMQSEVSQLQQYTEAMQAFSDRLASQLSASKADNRSLNVKLVEQQRQAEEALVQLHSELGAAQTSLSSAHARAQQAEARASSATSRAQSLSDELTRSEGKLGEMRAHMEQMLALHEGLTETAVGLGADDQAVAALLDELERRLGGSRAYALAGQLDELLLRSRTPSNTATRRPSLLGHLDEAGAPAAAPPSAAAAQQSSSTRTNFMVARRYLLSTRKPPRERAPSATPSPLPWRAQGPSPNAGRTSPQLSPHAGGGAAAAPTAAGGSLGLPAGATRLAVDATAETEPAASALPRPSPVRPAAAASALPGRMTFAALTVPGGGADGGGERSPPRGGPSAVLLASPRRADSDGEASPLVRARPVRPAAVKPAAGGGGKLPTAPSARPPPPRLPAATTTALR